MKYFVILLVLASGLSNCKDNGDPPVKKDPCHEVLSQFDPGFGIRYNDPSYFLTPGPQSGLDSIHIKALHLELGQVNGDIDGIKAVAAFVNKAFLFVNKGGEMIGKRDVNQLFEVREFYGCHSAALLISSICRAYGIPSLMVETASIKWAVEYNQGINQGYVGHVMSELYVEDHWILMDNNGSYVDQYISNAPFISTIGSGLETPAPEGLFALAKGIDCWSYGVSDSDDTRTMMLTFAKNLKCLNNYYPTNTYQWK